MSKHQQPVQINCPYFRGVNVNGIQYHGCIGMKQLITAESIHEYCLGPKCDLKIYKPENKNADNT